MLSFLVEIASSSPHVVADFIQQLVGNVTQQVLTDSYLDHSHTRHKTTLLS